MLLFGAVIYGAVILGGHHIALSLTQRPDLHPAACSLYFPRHRKTMALYTEVMPYSK
jgi:hypothetical protein